MPCGVIIYELRLVDISVKYQLFRGESWKTASYSRVAYKDTFSSLDFPTLSC